MSALPYTPEERARVAGLLEEFGRAAGNGGADRALQFLVLEACKRLEATVVEVSLERDSKHNAMKMAVEIADELRAELRSADELAEAADDNVEIRSAEQLKAWGDRLRDARAAYLANRPS